MLEGLGAEVETAVNGQQAVNKFIVRRNQLDVILMDVFMPVMNGIEALKEMRKFEKDNEIVSKTPIIIITGQYTKCDRLKLQGIECDDFLCKPLDKEMLIQSIKRVTLKKDLNKILIIEDDESQAFILKTMLNQLQITNIEVRNNFTET